ncbi:MULTISPECIES: porin [unclassified Burkholderia]|uniref:porin n=1 Tax=unclassified Burkholderia TaxID=2613784 RepID=UPI000F562678|nr:MULTISPECIES: porin [unclassified Burkholderia]RQR70267.1 porin [Burkholderia sp. Bp9011]RQZ39422.1 porin [Burkholderia sp. Bp9099]
MQAICACSFAQSSMTIYGSLDGGLTYVNNMGGHSNVMLQDGISKNNAVGFAGVDYLGGGLSALFKLENGYSVGTGALGQGGLLFGKQAYLGLRRDDVGQVTLGRQYDFTILLDRYMSCFNCGIYSVENSDIDRVAGERLNNSVQFQSANLKGFTYGAMYAFGQNAAALTTNAGRAYSANLTYTNGQFSVVAVLTDINGAPMRAGSLGAPTVLGVKVKSGSTLTLDNQRIAAVGAYYQLGAWTPSLVYSNTRLKLGSVTSTDQILRFGTTYQMSPFIQLDAQLSADRFEQSHWYTVNCAVDYFLSKRTDVYIELAGQRATGAGAVASIFLTASSSTSNQFLARVGMKHLF